MHVYHTLPQTMRPTFHKNTKSSYFSFMADGAETRFEIPIKGNLLVLFHMLITCIIFLHLVFDKEKVLENLIHERKMRMDGVAPRRGKFILIVNSLSLSLSQ